MIYTINRDGNRKEYIANNYSKVLAARILLSTTFDSTTSSSWENEGDSTIKYLDGSLITGNVQFEANLSCLNATGTAYAALGYYDTELGWTVIEDSAVSETGYYNFVYQYERSRSGVFTIPDYYTRYALFLKSGGGATVGCSYAVIIITPDICETL